MQKNIKKFGSIFSLSLFFWLGFHLSVRAFECQGDYCLECPVKNLQDDVNVPLSLRATTQQFSNKQEVARFCREKIFFEKTGPFVLNKPLVLDFPEDQDSDQDNWNFILDGKVGNQNAIIDGTELAPGQCALIVNTPLVLLQNLQIRSATCELAVCTGPEGSFDHANVKIVSLDQGDNDGDLICKSYTDPEKSLIIVRELTIPAKKTLIKTGLEMLVMVALSILIKPNQVSAAAGWSRQTVMAMVCLMIAISA
jgi:hypothetical protein